MAVWCSHHKFLGRPSGRVRNPMGMSWPAGQYNSQQKGTKQFKTQLANRFKKAAQYSIYFSKSSYIYIYIYYKNRTQGTKENKNTKSREKKIQKTRNHEVTKISFYRYTDCLYILLISITNTANIIFRFCSSGLLLKLFQVMLGT